MKATFVQIIIERDPMTKIPKLAAPWEVPIYRSQYGDEKIEVLSDTVEVEISELPDATEEYMRLRDVFGIEPDTKQSHVDLVYGRGLQAVEPLTKAIKASIGTGKKAKAGDEAIAGAQDVVDGPGGVDDETVERREKAAKTAADNLAVEQRSNRNVGAREPLGIAKVIADAADANAAQAADAASNAEPTAKVDTSKK